MAEYIYREQLLELINENCKYKTPTNEYTKGCNDVCDWAIKIIKNIPTADVQEVKHGRWIRKEYYIDGERSICMVCCHCGANQVAGLGLAKYCYMCGAKMDGKDGD